jgi:hypothetical protein
VKTLIGTNVVGLALLFSGAALADNPNWSPEKAAQVEINRCANAGLGNGKELLGETEVMDPVTEEITTTTTCLQGDDLNNSSENPNDKGNGKPQRNPDIDPGNSGKNANNRKAPK